MTEKKKLAYLFRHMGAGEVEEAGAFSSAFKALKSIGNPHPRNGANYINGQVIVMWSSDGRPYHVIWADTLPEAKQEAQRRAMAAEAWARVKREAILSLSHERLAKLCSWLPPSPLPKRTR